MDVGCIAYIGLCLNYGQCGRLGNELARDRPDYDSYPGAKRLGKSFVAHLFRAMVHHAVRWGPLLYAEPFNPSVVLVPQPAHTKSQRAGLLLR
jgi:hypothetical protein